MHNFIPTSRRRSASITGSGRPREGGAASRSTNPSSCEVGAHVASDPPAKFFVNQGLVTSRTDVQHLLRPILKQTVSYRFYRLRDLVAHGSGWVERIVAEEPEVSTYFTPIAITINVDSFEHLEFETRPDQLLVYTLVQGDERVVIEFVPERPTTSRRPWRRASSRSTPAGSSRWSSSAWRGPRSRGGPASAPAAGPGSGGERSAGARAGWE